MDYLLIIFVALFLPIFPLSIVFNLIFTKIKNPGFRSALFLIWPLIGIYFFQKISIDIDDFFYGAVLFTSMLYGFRMLAMREVGTWSGFMATSLWALLWIPLLDNNANIYFYSLWLSLPLVMMTLLVYKLETCFGAAFTEINGGLAQTMPRLSGIFVIVVLALIATPIFPSFFVTIDLIFSSSAIVASIICAIWLIWSWAGMRLIQGITVGKNKVNDVKDISITVVWVFSLIMIAAILLSILLFGQKI
tara:strand:+ start:539 stop:1282 length:744 start_codon:yes stop_codon:yes gene_type:complete